MSSGNQLLDALAYLKSEDAKTKAENSFDNLYFILRKTNNSLAEAWGKVHAAYLNVHNAANTILSGVHDATSKFANATIENERTATASAESFQSNTDAIYSNLLDICNKYGISGTD